MSVACTFSHGHLKLPGDKQPTKFVFVSTPLAELFHGCSEWVTSNNSPKDLLFHLAPYFLIKIKITPLFFNSAILNIPRREQNDKDFGPKYHTNDV